MDISISISISIEEIPVQHQIIQMCKMLSNLQESGIGLNDNT